MSAFLPRVRGLETLSPVAVLEEEDAALIEEIAATEYTPDEPAQDYAEDAGADPFALLDEMAYGDAESYTGQQTPDEQRAELERQSGLGEPSMLGRFANTVGDLATGYVKSQQEGIKYGATEEETRSREVPESAIYAVIGAEGGISPLGKFGRTSKEIAAAAKANEAEAVRIAASDAARKAKADARFARLTGQASPAPAPEAPLRGAGAASPRQPAGAGIPPGAPPAPPTGPILPPLEPPAVPPIQKLRDLVKQAEPLPGQTEALRHAERQRRVAASAAVLQRGGRSEAAYQQSRAMLGGEMPRASFTPPETLLAPEEVASLRGMLGSSGLQHYEEITAKEAFDKLMGGRLNELAPHELTLIDRVYGEGLAKQIAARQPIDWWEEVAGLISLPQTLAASSDLSAPFRQGFVIGAAHPKEWAASWKPMIDAGLSEGSARRLDKSLRGLDWVSGHANPDKAALSFDRVGGHLSDIGTLGGEAQREAGRAFQGTSRIQQGARRLFPVRASERAYVTNLNYMRGKVYATEAEKMWGFGVRDLKQFEALAKVINHASGWSEISFGQISAGRTGINAFFAPRLFASRIQVALDPFVQPGSFFEPSARQLAAKHLVAAVTIPASLLTLVSMGTGAALTWNPIDTDFGKLVHNNTRIDLLGGFSPLVRFVARLQAGEGISSAGDQYDVSSPAERLKLATDFLRTKESPIASLLTDVLTGETAIGKKVEGTSTFVRDRALEMLVPFFAQDVYDVIKQEGIEGAPLALPGLVGGGVLSYTSLSQERNDAAQSRFGKPYDDLLSSEQKQIDEQPDIVKLKESREPTEYAQDRDRRKDKYQADIDQKVKAWEQGRLSKPLPELLSDIKKARFESLEDFRNDVRNKKMFADLPDRKHQATLDGYFSERLTVSKPDGEIDWEKTIPLREAFVRGLDAKERAWLEDYVGVKESEKTQIERDLSAYNDKREKAGYFREGITAAEKAKLDASNPDIDVDTWRYYGGVEGEPAPTLNSPTAVDKALALGLPNRPVKLVGTARPVNESKGTEQAWTDTKRLIEVIPRYVESQQDAEAKRLYQKPFADVTPDQKSAVKRNIMNRLQQTDPSADALLAFWGQSDSVHEATVPVLVGMFRKYDVKFDPAKIKVTR